MALYGVGGEPGLSWEEEAGTVASGFDIVPKDGDIGGPGTGAVAEVNGEIRESSVPVSGASSGSACADNGTSGGSGVGPRAGKELLLNLETARLGMWVSTDNVGLTSARPSDQ